MIPPMWVLETLETKHESSARAAHTLNTEQAVQFPKVVFWNYFPVHIRDMRVSCGGEGSASKVLQVGMGGPEFDS